MAPITKTCRISGKNFIITDEDQAFYVKMGVPMPTLCPEERTRRKLIWRNERKLYHRKCDLCQKTIISIYSPDKPYKVYCPSCYHSDKWDALKYGRDFDFNRPFFEQFNELMLAVPALSLNLQKENQNCDYTNLTTQNKDSYLIFAALKSEDSYYCTYLHRCKNTVDSFFVFDCELCYECIDCYNCYQLFYSQNCQNCNSSYFLNDCKSCEQCFGCSGLVNKKYHIFNKPCVPEEYKKRVAEYMSSKEAFLEAQKGFNSIKLASPHKYYAGLQNENFSGDHVSFSKNAEFCFDCTNLEDCKYCTWLHDSRDCYDCYAWGQKGEMGYENHLCGNNFYNVMFCDACWNEVSETYYCHSCFNNVKNLFGCTGLEHKEFCIFNKQYSREEYFLLKEKIIEHMKKTGEWGEFFPANVSPFCYNETVAEEYFPLTEGSAREYGFRWFTDNSANLYQGQKITLPWSSKDASPEIVSQILSCETCGKNYKFIKQEFDFYKRFDLPLPCQCFDCRYQKRRLLRNPRALWNRACAECSKNILTSYSPDRTEKVLCEECYLKTVY
ncbi:MAG: hypothetical protein WC897_04415 [Candidatus Gracilibacteria bacterium]